MFDPKKLLDELLGTKVPGTDATLRDKASQATQMARDNPLAAGALAAVLLGTGTGRAITGSALKMGGLAAIAGLAYKAYQNYQSGQQPEGRDVGAPELVPPPTDTSFHPSLAPQGESEFALTLVRAMIASAKADGQIDDTERNRIGDRLRLAGLDTEVQDFMVDELERPIDIDSLVAQVRTDAQKVELYTASRLAIDPDTNAESSYLKSLAQRLRLPHALVDHIEATVSSART